MKRKATSEIDEERKELFKSLKNSITQFLDENATSLSIISKKKKLNESLDEEQWKKYRERLQSFSLDLCSKKTKEISPSICASYGWHFVDNDFLQCKECHKFLCITVPEPPLISLRILKSCIKSIQRKLTEAHDVTCAWRTNSNLNLRTPYNIIERYKMFEAAKTNKVLCAENVIDADLLLNFTELNNKYYLILAICGWLPSNCGNKDRIECLLCGRNVSLIVFSNENLFHPLENHYNYCPIIDKEFPLWRDSINIKNSLKNQKEPIMSHVLSVKSLLNNLFKK